MKTSVKYLSIRLIYILAGMSLLVVSCKKDEKETIPAETGTVTDIDGNTYATIKIGNQWWMTEDLRVIHFANGTIIHKEQTDSLLWSTDSAGAYCEVMDNNQVKIGILYKWNVMQNNGGVAPEGWHVPDDAEWKELEQHLGLTITESDNTGWRGSNEGDKLKVPAPASWTPYGEVWGTNESGFSAKAIGCRMFNGGWGYPGLFATGFWWSSSEQTSTTAFYRHLDYKKSGVYRDATSKTYGFSIRCVKD
ncbi:MAG: fibrobacter succinogenes major paralogous domain-containing protein [Bacteroidota bacterium]